MDAIKKGMGAAAALLALGAGPALAEGGLKALVPFPAGGPTDTMARETLAVMSRHLGEPIAVENVGGGGGSVATKRAADAASDGKTILVQNVGLATLPALHRSAGLDLRRDLEPIGEVADSPMVLVGGKGVQAKDARELLATIKSSPKTLSLANAGSGSSSHLCGLLLQTALKTEMPTMPYKGTAAAIDDLKKGRVSLMCAQATDLAGPISRGELRAFMVAQDRRVATIPAAPTAAEAGLPALSERVWLGLFAPKGTPKARVDQLSAALQKTVADPAFRARMAEVGSDPVERARATPEALRAKLASEIERWTPIIQAAGSYVD